MAGSKVTAVLAQAYRQALDRWLLRPRERASDILESDEPEPEGETPEPLEEAPAEPSGAFARVIAPATYVISVISVGCGSRLDHRQHVEERGGHR